MTKTVRMRGAVWLLCLPTGGSAGELLQGVRIPLDSEFLVAHVRDHDVVLTEMYHISDQLQEFRFGTWNPSGGLCVTSVGDFYDRRSNLQGTVINAASIQVLGLTTHKL
jgi:hypothetical protein